MIISDMVEVKHNRKVWYVEDEYMIEYSYAKDYRYNQKKFVVSILDKDRKKFGLYVKGYVDLNLKIITLSSYEIVYYDNYGTYTKDYFFELDKLKYQFRFPHDSNLILYNYRDSMLLKFLVLFVYCVEYDLDWYGNYKLKEDIIANIFNILIFDKNKIKEFYYYIKYKQIEYRLLLQNRDVTNRQINLFLLEE